MMDLVQSLTQPLAGSLVYDANGSPSAPPPLTDNYVGRWLYTAGLTSDKLRLTDTLRTGTVRPLQPGRCLTLNGSTQYVAGPTRSTLESATFSAAMWVKLSDITSIQVPFLSNRSTGNYWYLGHFNAKLFVYAGAGTINATTTADLLPLDTWVHVGYSYNGSQLKLYVNGISYAVTNGTVAYTPGSTSMEWRLGYDQATATYSPHKFAGVYLAPSQVLTDAEFAQLANNEFVAITNAGGFFWKLDQPNSALQHDSSGNGNHGTIAAWASGVHYEGSDVPYSWQNEVGYSAYTNGVGTNIVADANATLSASEYTATANQEYAPATGTLVADKYLETAATAVRYIGFGDNITVASTDGSTPYVAAFDIKGIGRTNVQAYVYNTSATKNVRVTFTLTGEGAVSSLSAVTFAHCGGRITYLGGGWYRCEIGLRPDSGNTVFKLTLYGENASSYAGDTAKGFYLANRVFKSGHLFTPRNESNTSLDVLGNSPQYSGRCPLEPPLGNSNCLTLNGSNQYVTVGTGTWDTDGTQAMEISVWFKTTANGTIVSSILNSGTYRGWELILSANTLLFQLINTSNTNHLQVATVSTGWLDNSWHQADVTYDGSRTGAGIVITVDGIRQATTTNVSNLTATSAGGAESSIGSRNNASSYFNGSLCGITVTIGATTWRIPCSEGSGSVVHETVTKTAKTIANAGSNWSVLQDKYHHNLANGFRLSGAVRIPAEHGSSTTAADNNALTNPAGVLLNNPESEIDFTCGEPDASIWDGYTIPDAYQFGDDLLATDLRKREASSTQEDRFSILI